MSSSSSSPNTNSPDRVVVGARSTVGAGHAEQSVYSRLRLLVEKAGDMVWTVDLAMRPTYVSASIRHHLGYTPDDAMRVSMQDVFSPDSYRLALQVLADEMARDSLAATDADRTRTLELDLVHKDGHLVPVEVCYSALRDARGKPVEIMAVARNISERRRVAEENRAGTEKMIRALQQTVQALATLMEMRDSYTAGHQRRVADLARAIGLELGLPPDTITGLELAGLIHDIGKVRVPAEILGSTRRLCAAEFEIIKMHATVGYEVLSGIDFPWPIADAVHQHHERMDGSGYPMGLVGNDIIIEARILAVADVMEAMASERPYRKTLGIDLALEEIVKYSGILYDAAVAHACVKVFRQGGYTFEPGTLPIPSVDSL
ncbi:MAG: HD domain-containing protein [Dehalococcoidia bacterium]|nr:HD domain-containing protein [Dehalococcoidia bacterium]